MANFTVKLYDRDNVTLLDSDVSKFLFRGGQVSLKLDGDDSFTFTADVDNSDFAQLTHGRIVELIHNDQNFTRRYRIHKITKKTRGNIYFAEILCKSLKYDLLNTFYKYSGQLIEQRAQTQINAILSGSGWTAGSIVNSAPLTLDYNYESVLAALRKVRDAVNATQSTRVDLWFNDNKTVDLKVVGNQLSSSSIEFQKNLKDIAYSTELPKANKVYIYGGAAEDGSPMTIRNMRFVVVNLVNAQANRPALNTNKIVSSPNDWVGYNLLNITPGSEGVYEITASSKDGDQSGEHDDFTTSGGNFAVGDIVQLCLPGTTTPVDFLLDQVSINTYGVREGVFRDESFSDFVNLIGSPYLSASLSGTYVGGLCQGWSKVGEPTLSENLNTAYFNIGSKSQKIVSGTYGSPVAPTVAVDSGEGGLSGSYNYKIAWVSRDGQGNTNTGSASITIPQGQRCKITNTSTPPGKAIAWRIYRTKDAGTTYYMIADVPVSKTVFYDSIPDSMLSITDSGGSAFAGGDGIEKTFEYFGGDAYSALVHLIVESGRVRVELELDDIFPDNGVVSGSRATPNVSSATEFVVMINGIVGKKLSGTGKLRIVSHEGAATFYVDGAIVVRNQYAPSPERFFDLASANQLAALGFDYLQKNKDAQTKVSSSVIDYFAVQSTDEFQVGDKITVAHSRLGINITVRIIGKKFDILQPWSATYDIEYVGDGVAYKLRELNELTRKTAGNQAKNDSAMFRSVRGVATGKPTIAILEKK